MSESPLSGLRLKCYRLGLFGGVGIPLADGAGGVGSVSELPQLPKSRSTPTEQLGKQIEGSFGWRASAGSDGRCGGCVDGSAIGGKLLAHPPLSSTSTLSIILNTGNLLLAILNHSIDASAPSLFLGAGGSLSHAA
ncbi:hypothetical protein [Variovorax sp. PDNC026]|uniref:hypothetical protein n=1 Tax=Variovorax sp. PDNC026 TaxID=2811425 RepID=UPI001F058A59|nr:hypothetical protein [Variovorax sp. PDNC026]